MANPILLADLEGRARRDFTLELNLPDHVDTENIYVHARRLSFAAATLGPRVLHIRGEGGPVSERSFGASMEGGHWRIADTGRGEPLVRTVGAHESEEAGGGDWIVINRNEVFDRILAAYSKTRWEYRLAGLDYDEYPQSLMWARMINLAVGEGLRELTRQQVMRNPLIFGKYIGAQVLSRRNYLEAVQPDSKLKVIAIDFDDKKAAE